VTTQRGWTIRILFRSRPRAVASEDPHGQSYLRAGNTKRACETLSAFIKEVRAAGRRISPTQAQELIITAQRIRGAIGC
jgi:hypothetical protein